MKSIIHNRILVYCWFSVFDELSLYPKFFLKKKMLERCMDWINMCRGSSLKCLKDSFYLRLQWTLVKYMKI